VAAAEARTALTVFEDLGAGRDADAAAALLRELGVKAARRGPKNIGRLTKREQEVLGLLGEGMSNPRSPSGCSSPARQPSITWPASWPSSACRAALKPPGSPPG
jgi:hypothetical protein